MLSKKFGSLGESLVLSAALMASTQGCDRGAFSDEEAPSCHELDDQAVIDEVYSRLNQCVDGKLSYCYRVTCNANPGQLINGGLLISYGCDLQDETLDRILNNINSVVCSRLGGIESITFGSASDLQDEWIEAEENCPFICQE